VAVAQAGVGAVAGERCGARERAAEEREEGRRRREKRKMEKGIRKRKGKRESERESAPAIFAAATAGPVGHARCDVRSNGDARGARRKREMER